MILEVGSINLDYIIHCKDFPRPKESILVNDVELMLGGKGAVQISAIGRLGAEAVIIGMIGENDPSNSIIYEGLKWANVSTDCLEVAPNTKSGSAFVCINECAQNEIIIHVAANGLLTPAIVEKHRKQFERASVCITEFALPMETCEYSMKLAKECGALAIVNPAPYAEMPESFYQYIDIITPNEIEASQFCGFDVTDEKSAAAACDFFHGKGVKNVVITMGDIGAFVSDSNETMMIKSYPVKAIDTSGAGDSFNGGLAYACEKKYDIFTAARFGNAVASLSVQRKGTTRSMPTLAEVEQVFNLNLA